MKEAFFNAIENKMKVDPSQTEAVMKYCRQSENVCDFLSVHEAASDFSHYAMPA